MSRQASSLNTASLSQPERSSNRPNRGFQEFKDHDRAFIIRFPQDNTFVALDYKSPSILALDLVERLGLAKSDKVMIRCKNGDFEGKVWFLGSHTEVKEKEMEAAKLMERVEAGESINLSNISLGASLNNTEPIGRECYTSPIIHHNSDVNASDHESDVCTQPPQKRTCLESTVDTPAPEEPSNSAILSKMTKVQSTLMEWMQKNYSFAPPASEGEQGRVRKIYNGEDLLDCPGDCPTLFGRNVARKLWSKEELMNNIMSPGKDLEFMPSPRVPMTPTRKALFRECVEYKFAAVPGCYVKSRNSVNQLGTEMKNRPKKAKISKALPPSTPTGPSS